MKKFIIAIIFVLVFIGTAGGSFWYVKKTLNTDNKDNVVIGDDGEPEEVIPTNEHIVEQNKFLTGWEWNGEIVEKFPDDERYRMRFNGDERLMCKAFDSEEVYKEYAERISVLPQDVDFSKNFVVLVTTEEFKEANMNLKIADFTFNEDNGTMNIILREDKEAGENAYLNYNAWYAIVNDRSLLRPATNVEIDL